MSIVSTLSSIHKKDKLIKISEASKCNWNAIILRSRNKVKSQYSLSNANNCSTLT